MSLCPVVRIEQFGSHWTDFHGIWYGYFPKTSRENSKFIKIGQDQRVHDDQTHTCSYFAQFFLQWEMFQAKFVQNNQNSHLIINNIFFKHKTAPFMRQCGSSCYRFPYQNDDFLVSYADHILWPIRMSNFSFLTITAHIKKQGTSVPCSSKQGHCFLHLSLGRHTFLLPVGMCQCSTLYF